ncbi:PhzF family phenazine biosynthesis protein [Anaerotignum sp.]|uniref:PhzF family phenazine biosynthesis protein n=1 Tax=Anaerotignum sp. TaxID=2039241 RepID=UPI0028A8ACCA|nr:PhzF family phenazine biosynthesis protein [Anaerotignum sp.]
MKYYVVDAFAQSVFGGNPAGICVLEKPLPTETMQMIATENNLSETAFVYKNGFGNYDLRWFTPKAEIDLCGHATLGTAYVICHFVDPDVEKMAFSTLSGILTVKRKENRFEMDFPSRMPEKITITQEMIDAIGVKPKEAYLSRDLVLVFDDEKNVEKLNPDFQKVFELEVGLGLVVTAKGTRYDFVSRCFYPKLGVNEDPVTGSAHSSLIPLWAEKLEKNSLVAKQVSKRGGVLTCCNVGERVEIGGEAILYLQGEIYI